MGIPALLLRIERVLILSNEYPFGEPPMSVPELRHPGYTLEDWKTWEGHWELIHGIAYPTFGMTPAPSLEHQRVSVNLASGLSLIHISEPTRPY